MITDPRLDPRLVRDIDTAEANKLEAYPDTLGNWTIGRGHLMPKPAPGKSWQGFTISNDVSDRYFLGDLISAWQYAQRLPEWQKMDTPARQNALIELCFAMRGKELGFVHMREGMEAQDWRKVHDELLNSTWAHEVQPHGFDTPGRATRLANYFLTGAYP